MVTTYYKSDFTADLTNCDPILSDRGYYSHPRYLSGEIEPESQSQRRLLILRSIHQVSKFMLRSTMQNVASSRYVKAKLYLL